jgi:Na+/H+ antiporter NhaC
MDYCFAVCEGNVELYSILSKIATMVPETVTNAALTYYSTEDVKAGFWDIVKENLVYILAAGLVIVIVILILAIRSIRLERKANAERQVVKDLNRKVFVDALTSVRNKGAFDEFREKLQKVGESNLTNLCLDVCYLFTLIKIKHIKSFPHIFYRVLCFSLYLTILLYYIF